MTDQAYPDALPAQHRLHWYVLERVLGQGGFGITYLARDTNLDQPVAIKEYLPVEVATRQADATIRARTGEQRDRYRWGLDRFIREARTLARFDHRSIVRVLSVFEMNGTAYMVMRFEDGENLAAVLESRGTLAEDELLGILLPVLDGLGLVHDAGFIHRDIKPDNLQIRTDGSPVLLDFGSARQAVGKVHILTILVALGYAPFEQYYSNSENQGPWTDIYSLGATCYRAIAGRAPIDAIARSKGILGSTRDVLVPAAVVGAGRYSGRFLAAIDHALQFAEKDRPQTIAEWRQELVGERQPEPVRPPAKESSAPPRVRTEPAVVADSAPEPGGAGRPTWAPIGWGIAGAALAAIAIGLMLHFYPAGHEAAPGAAAAPQPPPAEPAADQVAALEKKLAEERERASRAEAERKRLEDERAAAAKPASEPTPVVASRAPQSVPDRKTIARPEAARPVERVAAAPKVPAAPEPKPAPAAPLTPTAVEPSTPTPLSTPAQQLASAERAISRGSYSEGAELLKPLAERGDASAQYLLGTLYLRGQGVARSDQDALRLLGRAAEQGFAKAQTGLGDLYAQGRGVARDEGQARAWYQKSAAQGDAEAQLRLGDLYASGHGVPQNSFRAYVWYGVAARSGNASAREKQARVASLLQPAEIQQADRLIDSQSGQR